MSQPTPDPTSKQSASQPASDELSTNELDRVTGGDQAQTTTTKPTIQEIHITKVYDKSSPTLF